MLIRHLNSLAELRRYASLWDDLWWRSDVTMPMARAELVARWAEHFAGGRKFCAMVVEEDGQWRAAMPLLHRRVAGVLDAVTLPWSPAGELLWDVPPGDEARVAHALLAAVVRLNTQLVWLDGVPLDTPRWQAMAAAAQDAGLVSVVRRQHRVPRLEIHHDWPACQAAWSRKHRWRMRCCQRRLEALGGLNFRWIQHVAPADVEPWLRRIWAVEDAGWKGAAGTSVLRTPHMLDFFGQQTEQAACWDEVTLAVLECGGEPIAFCYGLMAKGVFHSCKIGYDARLAAFAPGHLLRYFLLERLHADPHCRAVDFVGPWTAAHSHWRPDAYQVGRLMIAPRLAGRAALAAYRMLKGRALQAETHAADGTQTPESVAAIV
jgi:CelD/BcsL family acetyltransferase involved in cellulose biosynthesis